jgi:ribonuclease HI
MLCRHSKFYAIKKGRETGVFLTWDECKTHTFGFQNALFRAFPTREEAHRWLADEPEFLDITVCRIYTDGSHQRAKDYLGVGAWALWDEEEHSYSAKVTREMLDSYGVPKDAEVSNPTAEFIAFAQILRKFQNKTLAVQLVFVSDYVGIKNWMEGTWKTKEPHITAILKSCKETIKTIKGVIVFEWVKGHSHNIGNTHADHLAGNHDEIDTFNRLIDGVSKKPVPVLPE